MKAILLMPVLLLAGCETTMASGRGTCDSASVQRFVGAVGTADLGRAALRQSRARFIRWLPPGAVATMDFRQNRLNVRLDERNFVTGLDCG